MEKLNDACAAWGDKYEKCNPGLEKNGPDVDALNMTAAPKRYFCCYIEDWEKPLLKNNEPVAKAKLSDKYQGLVFCDIDNVNKVMYTVSSGKMKYGLGRKCGWTVLAEPFDYNRTDLDCLDPFKINKDLLIYLTNNTDQNTSNNVNLIYRNGNINVSASEEDDQYGQV